MTAEKLPFDGEWSRAPEKKYQETVVLVPFYAARKQQLRRHAELLNRFGYDVVLFHLSKEKRDWRIVNNLFSSHEKVGLKHIWADEIECILNAVPGKKTVFAFSNPSASAIEAIARRQASDIAGLVVDSGPAFNLYESMMNYFTFEDPIRIWPLKAIASVASSLIWAAGFSNPVTEDLKSLPPHFRVLSIRGWKDKLIPPHQIDLVFESQPQLLWQKLSLPQAGHLNGLRDFPQDYESPLQDFLHGISSPLEGHEQPLARR